MKFRFSIDNPVIRTPAGQWINQTDMDYFIGFLFKNLEKVKQKTDEFYEDKDQIRFWLWGLDYIEGKNLEKYRIILSKQYWLPIRIERYDLEGKPLEVSIIQNYAINAPLSDKLFVP
jgi:outer membrane lipoprotein-sorting protein